MFENKGNYTDRKDGNNVYLNTGDFYPAQDNAVSGQELVSVINYGEKQRNARPKKFGRAGIIAVAISCTIFGAAVGGGVGAVVSGGMFQPPVAEQSGTLPVKQQASAQAVASLTGGMTVAQVYEAVNTAVVAISTESTQRNVFGQVTPVASAGSGFVLTADGYIVTNNHVIAGASKIKVTFSNSESYDAAVVGRDSATDLAVLKIEASNLDKVTVGDSGLLKVGDPVIAIGNPLGELANTLTAGVVSALSREINIDGTPMRMMQTDAAISPGNSGGPLFNANGEVVGINSAKSSGNGVEGIGFAIPINDAQSILDKLMANGYVSGRAQLGVQVKNFTEQMSEYYGLPQGVYIVGLDSGSCAEKAGLAKDDIITSVDGKEVKTVDDLSLMMRDKTAGDTVKVKYSRDKEVKEVDIKLDEKQPDSKYSDETTQGSGNGFDAFDEFGGFGGFGDAYGGRGGAGNGGDGF